MHLLSEPPGVHESRWTAGELIVAIEPISGAMSCGDVLRQFSEDPFGPPAYAVLAPGGLGLIDRVHCASVLAQRYGRELYDRKPIATIMDADPLIVDAGASIGAVSTAIASRKPSALQTGFVITSGGEYAGIGLGLELMRRSALQTEATLRELQNVQASLIRSEKLASLGGLVSGVAHEINTPVGVTLTAASQLLELTAELVDAYRAGGLKKSQLDSFVDACAEGAQLIVGNARRAAELVQSFKQVAVDRTSDERRSFDLKTYVREVLMSLRPHLRQQHHRITVHCPNSVELDGYPGALSQVLTNLVMNALLHGFEGRTDGLIVISVQADGDRVELIFEDNGCGIPSEHQDRVFEPFFTTKRGAGGSGLGLNIVYNIVNRTLGGSIVLDSVAGRGTRFIMHFPRVAPAQTPSEVTDDRR